MNKQQNNPVVEQPVEQIEHQEGVQSAHLPKKQFVEPLVSVPVDVLESTTFFQSPTFDTSDA